MDMAVLFAELINFYIVWKALTIRYVKQHITKHDADAREVPCFHVHES